MLKPAGLGYGPTRGPVLIGAALVLLIVLVAALESSVTPPAARHGGGEAGAATATPAESRAADVAGTTATPAPTPVGIAAAGRVAPYAMWNVPQEDLAQVRALGVGYVVALVPGTPRLPEYLAEAAALGLRVVIDQTDSIAAGAVNDEAITATVLAIRGSPAVFGYLSISEPANLGVDLDQLRALYRTFKQADPARPVIVLFNRLQAFGSASNPYGTGVADIVAFDLYPVRQDGYSRDAPLRLETARTVVRSITPSVPLWLVVQGHGNRSGGLAAPTPGQLRREVRDGRADLRAAVTVFYTWRSTWYDSTISGRPDLQATIRSLTGVVHRGTS